MFLKISPLKGVMRFGRKGKLSPRFVGPFEILERAYRLALPPNMSRIHDVFHVSMLRKYIRDPTHVLTHQEVELNPEVEYEERPIKILDRKVKVLRNKEVPLVKLQWKNRSVEEATWEREQDIHEKYPDLF